ncbi:MAG TPA: pyrimidine dimer DNA glycosylase/endonuclease V [Usitatibacter sp.]|nr:pyrimidine dimer DNA glycosylase/endonuclease V [Usitatibacter sp.]
MRLWTLHPKYLDAQGLVALWREALLAQAVLRGRTLGYRNHPQLHRFRDHDRPRSAINAFLAEVHDESSRRGYSFDRAKVGPVRAPCQLIATSGQIEHEWDHLLRKLHSRDREAYRRWCKLGQPEPNPLFMIVTGPVAPWERLP